MGSIVGAGRTQPPAVASRCGAAVIPRTRAPAGLGLEPLALRGHLTALAQPGHDVHGRVQGAAREGAADADEALELDRHTLGQRADGVERAEVIGDRVKAARVHELGAGALRLLVVAQPHEIDELGLAGEVDVVGAGGGAGRHHRLAVVDVGADGGDDAPAPTRPWRGSRRGRRRRPRSWGRRRTAARAAPRACRGCDPRSPSGRRGRRRPGTRRSAPR